MCDCCKDIRTEEKPILTHKLDVGGGYRGFESVTDFEIWKNQK